MYIIFILFFMSLFGIIIMVGRKLAPVRNGEVVEPEHSHPFVPDVLKVKNFTFRNLKKYEHLTLVTVVRLYVRLSNFLKHAYEELKIKITNMRKARNGDTGEIAENKESSKFLKVISEYKQKVVHIKHRIKEEEENK